MEGISVSGGCRATRLTVQPKKDYLGNWEQLTLLDPKNRTAKYSLYGEMTTVVTTTLYILINNEFHLLF